MIDNFVKILQKQLVVSPEVKTNTMPDIDDEIDDEIESFGIPQTKVAVFWDYENFPIPSGINEFLFFEALFSSSAEERIISKRVYSKPEIIQIMLEIIKKNIFEYILGILSNKTNEVDLILITDGVQYCAKSNEALLVVLMAGDADYLSLIETLSKEGHEVRLVCNSINKISPSLKAIIPVIIDRNKILSSINQIKNNLYTFSSLTNYLLSIGTNNSLDLDVVVEEIQKFYINNLNKQIASLVKLSQSSPDYNWQYTISNGVLHKNEIIPSTGPSDSIPSRAMAHKQGLLFKLGYEEDFSEWEKTWNEYCLYEQDKSKLSNLLHQLYQIVPIPKVRNNIQKELVTMLFYNQTTNAKPNNKNFRNFATHNPDKPFQCKFCPRSFPIANSLNQHIRASHKRN